MPSKRLLMRQARDRARTEVTRLDDERLAVKRIAARECGMVLYTQEIERGQHAPPERVHILSLPHEVPWADTPTPEREMRRIKRIETSVGDLPPTSPRLGFPLTAPASGYPGLKPGEGVSNKRQPDKGHASEEVGRADHVLLGVRIRTRGDGRMVVEDL
jgi:hypothetical protein